MGCSLAAVGWGGCEAPGAAQAQPPDSSRGAGWTAARPSRPRQHAEQRRHAGQRQAQRCARSAQLARTCLLTKRPAQSFDGPDCFSAQPHALVCQGGAEK